MPIFSLRLSPHTQRQWAKFCAHKRGFVSLMILLAGFVISLCANVLANEKPLLITCPQQWYMPAWRFYPEQVFNGGQFATEPVYNEPFFSDLMHTNNCRVWWAPIPFGPDTVDMFETRPAPAAPSWRHWWGTDERQRDVLVRFLYGFRTSLVFALCLAACATIIGMVIGAIQGYIGGWVDLLTQRFIEIWGALPWMFVMLIASSLLKPGFLTLLLLSILFQWLGSASIVRAEFFRLRNFDYVRAARARGVSDIAIMWRHIMPNALALVLASLPFAIAGGITGLAALDFLGLGLPIGTASLGDLVVQASSNLQATWLSVVACVALGGTILLLMFVGEGLRDAFDPRR